MTNHNGENETRQFNRVNGDNETRQFGAPQPGLGNQQPRQQPPQRPQQYFPEPGSQNSSGFEQNYHQPQYDPVPSSYQVEEQKKSGSALAYVFAAIAAIAVVIAGVLFFLWRGAAADANKPAPEPVTETQTVTTEVPTTVTTTKDAPREEDSPEPPADLPTELPPEIQDQLDESGSDFESLLNELLGDLEANGGGENV
ncbi:hypothetical protein [Corynebacterium sp. HMSC078H07]|uniref:hypothetical protein n=1 Tax=Corynebacterium sp. HMSC078H07 TaxID=1739379 RepID=UPI0008A4BF06|nr:hypothetical protein [Corynebacterium sp. HMSC078H07]OFR62540.1 hypothetical protein HMPREF2875_00720 [Corynebacterium sp. HMSC078H07]